MDNLKFWDEIRRYYDGELYENRDKLIQQEIQAFFQHVKEKQNVIDKEEVFKLGRKFNFFSYSIWSNRKEINIKHNIHFGLKSGIIFGKESIIFFRHKADSFSIPYLKLDECLKIQGDEISNGVASPFWKKKCSQEDIAIIQEFIVHFKALEKRYNAEINKVLNQKHQKRKDERNKLIELRNTELRKLDLNNDGKIDLMDCLDFSKAVHKNQLAISQIDKTYLHKFTKLSNFLKEKSENLQSIYKFLHNDFKIVMVNLDNYLSDYIFDNLIIDDEQRIEDIWEFEKPDAPFEKPFKIELSSEDVLYSIELVKNLNNLLHSYNLLVFHSFNMLSALISGDLMAFYEIYEMFDKLGVFNTNWENEIALKLKTIGDKLDELILAINEMEENLIFELKRLNYTVQEGFSNLTEHVTTQLQEINSTIKWGNLISTIQTYQLYKINKQTKPLLKSR